MASFASQDFSHHRYSSFRPTYPAQLYDTIFSFHSGPRDVALDLGTGHALVARELSPRFAQVHASDPSSGMLQLARELSTANTNITFHESTAENSPFLQDGTVDIVTAAQAAHWFDYPNLWPELTRITRSGGTVAFWGYTDPIVVSRPRATELMHHYAYSSDPHLMGPYWQQPGRSIVQDKLRPIQPPVEEWSDITRIEYEPTTGEGTMFLRVKMRLGDMAEYVRTWSAFHGWQTRWPERKKRDKGGGDGDVVDELIDRIREDPELRGEGLEGGWKDVLVDLEFGTGLLLARRR